MSVFPNSERVSGLHHGVPGLHQRQEGDPGGEAGVHEGAAPRLCALRAGQLGLDLQGHRACHHARGSNLHSKSLSLLIKRAAHSIEC